MVLPRMEDPDDILAGLRRRVFDFANNYTGDYWDLAGQEPFNVIKYNISGDEYRVHCDGYCDGSPYVPGGRAATMVIYCQVSRRRSDTCGID